MDQQAGVEQGRTPGRGPVVPSLLDGGVAAGGWTPRPTTWERIRTDPDVARLTRVAGPALAIVAVQFVLFPIPAGIYLYGLVLGVLGALVAVGMALVYRANRIVNFAAGPLGLVPAVASAGLMLFSGVAFVPALLGGLVVAVVLGAGVEVLAIRRFARAPRLVLTVATIGLAQLLAVSALGLPFLWGRDPISVTTGTLDLPLDVTFALDPIVVRTEHLFALLLAPLVLWAVAGFLRRSPAGIALRAAAERADRASLLGVPVARIETLVWVLAAVLAFLGVFLRATVVGLPLSNPFVGFSAVLAALAAMMLGRLDDLPSVAVSAIALGILEQGVIWNNGDAPELVYPVFAVVVIAALALRRVDRLRAGQDEVSSWRAAESARPVPDALRRLPVVRLARVVGALGALVVALALPLVLGPGDELKAGAVVVFAIVGLSIVVLTGWAGQVSLGQMAFAGYGAAFGAIAFLDLRWDVMLALPVAGLFGAAIAVGVGLPALRLRGIFLAAVTLAFSVGSASYFLSQRQTDWIPRGRIEQVTVLRFITIDSPAESYLLAVVVAALLFGASAGIRRSRTGRILAAVRENELAAQSHGVSLTRAKLTAFALSGGMAAVAGCLYTIIVFGYSESLFAPTESFVVFTSTVVGGVGSMVGAVIGALFSRGGTWFLTGNWAYVPSAVGVLLVLWLLPGGLGGLAYRVRDRALVRVARRHGLPAPSLGTGRAPEPTDGMGELGPADARGTDDDEPLDPTVVLAVSDLDVAYGDVQVLFGVDLRVHRGEIVALLGTNGAGKSTLLKAVSGLLRPRRGTIRLHGDELRGRAAHEVAARGVVQMPGDHGVFPSLTVEENLRMACWLDPHHGRSARPTGRSAAAGSTFLDPEAPTAERLDAVLELFGVLADRLDDRAGDLSGGQQQMLSLAMSLLMRPDVLLIDELSLGLAPVIVEQLLDVVRSVAARGTAVVLVEQSVNVALSLADRAVFMEKGQVRFSGASSDLLDRPDLLRSVFLEGAAAALGADDRAGGPGPGGESPADVDDGLAAQLQAAIAWAAPTVASLPAPRFEVRGLTVAFGGIRAVDDVTLTVEPGEIVGVIGPNGAGKTTLFDLISGVTPAERGLVLLDGVDLAGLPPDERARRGIARSFQDARLYPSLTVSETLAVAFDRWLAIKDPFRPAVRAPSERQLEAEVAERVEELIELLGLGQFRDVFVNELSTGSRRIVDLACVLAHHPSIVLLDEPSSGIAQREAEALVPLLRKVHDVLGASMLVIEHDMNLIASVADRLVAMDGGRVVTTGPAEEVLRHPAVVAAYLGGDETVIARSGSTTGLGIGTGAVSSAPAEVGERRHRPARVSRAHRLRGMAGSIATAMALVTVAVAGGLGRDGGGIDPVRAASPAERAGVTEEVPVPIIYADALEARTHETIEWVENCDPQTGRIMMPTVYAPPCVPAFEGDNGGATSTGVTADTIKVALYVPQGSSDIRSVLQGAIDSPEAISASQQAYVDMLGDLLETYGREVELVRFEATGAMDDEVAARADAIRLAEEVQPFASMGGPPMTMAYAEELANRGILCFDCGLAAPDSFIQDNAPFIWGPLPSPEQYLLTIGDYIFNRVQGRKASFAGDREMRERERVFGVVRFEQKIPVFTELTKLVMTISEANGLEPAANEVYVFDLEKMPERAATIVAKLKAAEVTTVMFLGDPIMPIYLTQAATEQDYFPEWLVTGTVLTDTTAMGRYYDQEQWAHAFGLSNLPVQTPLEVGEAYRLHEWYFGEPPAARKTSQLVYQQLFLLLLGIHLAGPDLNPASFRDGMFHYPVSGGGVTAPRISFGRNGLFISESLGKRIDYLGIDDMAEIWWDAEAEGPDETGAMGKGMWRYASGGTRYLPGDMPDRPTDAFVEEDSVLLYDEVPADERPPEYPSPARGGS